MLHTARNLQGVRVSNLSQAQQIALASNREDRLFDQSLHDFAVVISAAVPETGMVAHFASSQESCTSSGHPKSQSSPASLPTRGRYVRLELLEGVAAWYAGDAGLARERLLSARAKWAQLQVSDDALASLANMGFRTAEVSPLPAAAICSPLIG